MKWMGRRSSDNVVDGRSSGFGGGFRGGAGGVKVGGIGMIVLVIAYTLMGGNPLELLPMATQQTQSAYTETADDHEKMEFVKVVVADTEDVWHSIFEQYQKPLQGKVYREPKVVVFHDMVQSACGVAGSQAGPFYCPRDEQVYLDLSFFDTLKNEMGAPGDFAISYVIAHEIGHHVQNLLGILGQQQALRDRLTEEEYNKISVRIELQADYLAGVFAHHMRERGYLENGDIEEAIRAAAQVGDDTIQKRYRGVVMPDAFTHGSAEMRVRWFNKGYQAGDLSEFDTFSPRYEDL